VSARKADPDLQRRRRESILNASAIVFAKKGYARARIEDIALEAGLGKSTVYDYFTDKATLFSALFEQFLDQMTTAFEEGLVVAEGSSPAKTLVDFSRHNAAIIKEAIELAPLGLEFYSASATPDARDRFVADFRALYHRLRGVVVARIQEGCALGEFRPEIAEIAEGLAAAYVGAFDGLMLQVWFDDDFDAVAAADALMSTLVAGMRPHHQRSPS
jgi:AcrR family transcriptional regulator